MKTKRDGAEARKAVEEAYRKDAGNFLARARRATRNLLDAEDALHDAFAAALANLEVLEAVDNLPGWIVATMRNRVVDGWRRRESARKAGETPVAAETIEEIAGAAGLSLEDDFEREELASALAVALGELPREERRIVEAQVFEGLTFSEIAERDGGNINTLMARKRRAVEKLARALRDWGSVG